MDKVYLLIKMSILSKVLGKMVILKVMGYKDTINKAQVMSEGLLLELSKALVHTHGKTEEANTMDNLVKV
jgi:hypothetical protein